MNREIKFRAWVNIGIDPYMTDEVNDIDFDDGDVFVQESFAYNWKKGEAILMQYTGLKDKNGAPIFESDVVEVLFNEGTYLKANPVIWSNNNCIFAVENGEMHESLSGIVNIEVIGNIFENPELVQKSS